MRIAGFLVLILLSGLLIAACDTSPGINGNGSNNGQYNNDNNTNNSCNGVNNCNNYSKPANGSPQSSFSQPTSPPMQVIQIQYKNLGVWTYWHADGPYPQPPAANGAIVAHGDILDDSGCRIRIFYSGDLVTNLGHGSFRLVELTGGDRNAILQYVRDNIQPPLQSAYGSCPII
jgi:hypothetical protein